MFDDNRLKKYRDQIDRIDQDIFDLLLKRFYYASKVGKIKYKKDLPIQNRKRESEMIATNQSNYAKTELSKSFIKNFLTLIFKESRRIQRDFDK